MIKTYLVECVRKSTNSKILLHIDAHNSDLAKKYAKRIIKDFQPTNCKLCQCPLVNYVSYKGGRLWKNNNRYIFLPQGHYKTFIYNNLEEIECTT